jgi:hypothetical protein
MKRYQDFVNRELLERTEIQPGTTRGTFAGSFTEDDDESLPELEI